jgi:hypothetical protein
VISFCGENFRGCIQDKKPFFIRKFKKCVLHESTSRE